MMNLACNLKSGLTNSDYELFTILAQDDDISALQVKNRDGEWIHADPIPVSSSVQASLITGNLCDQHCRLHGPMDK